MTVAAVTGGRDTSVAAYEDLRRHVLTASTVTSHCGVVLLLREGIAAWMARGTASAAPSTSAADRERRATAPLLSDDIHAGIIRVLASMALAGRGERHA